MSSDETILFASRGWICEHHDGRQTRIYRKEWMAKNMARLMGEGWYHREVKEPLLIVPNGTTLAQPSHANAVSRPSK